MSVIMNVVYAKFCICRFLMNGGDTGDNPRDLEHSVDYAKLLNVYIMTFVKRREDFLQ